MKHSIMPAIIAAVAVMAGARLASMAQKPADSKAQAPYRIMCIGDSITQGGKEDREEYTYRLPLQKLLLEANVKYEFLGSRTQGLQGGAKWPDVADGVPFQPAHEGYYGGKTKDVVAKVKAAWNDKAPLPDAFLIHLGTNDQDNQPHDETVKTPLRDLVEFIRGKNPKAVIFMGHLNLNYGANVHSIRKVVDELVEEMNTEASPVIAVQHYKGWYERPGEEPKSDTYDWVHPNPQGQMKMAKAWFEAMKPYIPGLAASGK